MARDSSLPGFQATWMPVRGATSHAALSALAALGALKGLKEPLPKTCAQVVLLLLPEKRSSRQELAVKFAAVFDGPPSLADYQLERALERLLQVGSVNIHQGKVLAW